MTSREDDRLETIFDVHRETTSKYAEVERENGMVWCFDCPVDIDDPRGQAHLKDFAWRFTEELTEVVTAFESGPVFSSWREELADALHFLVELAILADIGAEDVVPGKIKLPFDSTEVVDKLDVLFMSCYFEYFTPFTQTVVELGRAMNLLKNRPWKQSRQKTDEVKFRRSIFRVFKEYGSLCRSMGASADDIFAAFMNKSRVHDSRIEEGR